jgi:glutamate-1-semialdehyde 2,1-aminomutase
VGDDGVQAGVSVVAVEGGGDAGGVEAAEFPAGGEDGDRGAGGGEGLGVGRQAALDGGEAVGFEAVDEALAFGVGGGVGEGAAERPGPGAVAGLGFPAVPVDGEVGEELVVMGAAVGLGGPVDEPGGRVGVVVLRRPADVALGSSRRRRPGAAGRPWGCEAFAGELSCARVLPLGVEGGRAGAGVEVDRRRLGRGAGEALGELGDFVGAGEGGEAFADDGVDGGGDLAPAAMMVGRGVPATTPGGGDMELITRTYRQRTPGSAARAERHAALFPGGDFRAAVSHRPYPLTVASAAGPWLRDVDGHEYLDLLGNYTALVHGNAHPAIVEAATRAVAGGTCWAAANDHMIELAELLVERVASVERVRFCNSGTEATMHAAMVAREVTGRRRVLMARYGYHGSYDDYEVGNLGHAGPNTVIAPFGDAAAFEAVLAERGDQVACVILESVMGSSGVVPAPPGFLARVAEAARAAGALFVLDEVITFRLATGGAQALAGVEPDLTTFGKLIGGGFPVGALGGRADVLGVTDPARGRLPLSGTFNANPPTMAAGAAAVRELTGDAIAAIDRWCSRLADGLTKAAADHGVPFSSRRAGSLLNVFLSAEAPDAVAERTDGALMASFHLACLNNGLFFAPRGLMATSTVLSDELVDEAVDRATRAFADVASRIDP